MYCKKCGCKVDSDSVYCDSCGNNLLNKETQEQNQNKKDYKSYLIFFGLVLIGVIVFFLLGALRRNG